MSVSNITTTDENIQLSFILKSVYVANFWWEFIPAQNRKKSRPVCYLTAYVNPSIATAR